MALNCSPKSQSAIVRIVSVVEIQFESACALTNTTLGTTCHAKFQASEANGFEGEEFNIFPCISIAQTQDNLGRIRNGP